MRPETLVLNTFDRLSLLARRFLLDRYKANDARAGLPEQLTEPPILTRIFPRECKKIEETLSRILINLRRSRENIINRFDVLVTNYFNERNNFRKLKTPKIVMVPLPFLTEKYYNRILRLLAKRRSLAAAIQIQISLFEKIQIRETNIHMELGAFEANGVSPLHMAWAWLADKGFSYQKYGELADLVKRREYVKRFFNSVLESKEKFHYVYKAWMENKREDLVNILLKWFPKKVKPYFRIACSCYFTDLIFGLRDALEHADLSNCLEERVLRSYINVCMVNYGFFEYEVYNFLLSEGFPALPRLKYTLRNPDGEIQREVDVLAIDPRNGLVEVEITSSTNPEEIGKKIADPPFSLASRRVLLAPEEALKMKIIQEAAIACAPLERPSELVKTLLAQP